MALGRTPLPAARVRTDVARIGSRGSFVPAARRRSSAFDDIQLDSAMKPHSCGKPAYRNRGPQRHGRTDTYIEGEGWVTQPLCSPDTLKSYMSRPAPGAGDDPLAPEPPQGEPGEPSLKFCRLLPAGSPNAESGLVDLGLAMETEIHGVGTQGDSNVPAGYTYLGQFIDHDITAQVQDLSLGGGTVPPGSVETQRTPALDLDSLYGKGPGSSESGALYEADGVRFRIGSTSPTESGEPGGPIAGGFPNDLPRQDTKALIADGRNDENLAVAQTHLAFLKFHNREVERLRSEQPSLEGDALFQAARRSVTLKYQSIVLNDFLPRVMETDALQETLCMGPKLYTADKGDCMPIEVAAAAFRLGHSMVRPSYDWNRVFNDGGIPATFALLFEFSGVSGTRGPNDPPFLGKPTLPSNWIVDWTRLYDFQGTLGSTPNAFQNTRKLDVNLAMDLKQLPEFEQMQNVPAPLLSLSTRNLLRGRQMSLPSGQATAHHLLELGFQFTPVPSGEIANGPHRNLLEAGGLTEDTPLWYYILREAKVRHDGQRLGPVGSRLLAEFFVGAIQRTPISILNADDPAEKQPFSMPELLRQVGDLNPLGPAS